MLSRWYNRGGESHETPFVATWTHGLREALRLLVLFVTAPLGLYPDSRMLRQIVPVPETAGHPREEEPMRRTTHRGLTHDPSWNALGTAAHVESSLGNVESDEHEDGSPFSGEWMASPTTPGRPHRP